VRIWAAVCTFSRRMERVSSPLAVWLPSLGDVAFVMPIIFLFGRLEGARTLLSDGDTGWHIRTGDWILRHAQVPRQDLFSFTRPGDPWFAWEWLSEVFMAWLHRWSMAAVVLAAILVLSLTFWLLYRLARARSGDSLMAIGLTALAVAGSSIHWLARPHLATLLLAVVFLTILEHPSGRRLWLLVPLTALWANLHAGFIFGIVLVAVYAFEDRAHALSRIVVTIACLGASLCNPYGWKLHAHIARYLAADSWQFDHIHEFLSPNFHAPLAICFELMLALAAAAAVWHATRGRLHYLVLPAVTAHISLISARNIPLFLIVSAAPVCLAAVEAMRSAARRASAAQCALRNLIRFSADISAADHIARIPAASAVAIAIVAAMVAAPGASGKLRAEFDPRVFPARAVEEVRTPGSRIFTSDQWGDYLIYRLYPEIHVFVDGRSDFYGAAHEQLCQDVWNVRYDWQDKLARFRVNTLLVPVETPLAGALKQSGRWRLDYDDGVAIVFRATEGKPVSGLTVNRRPEYPQSQFRSEPKCTNCLRMF
jgi:hypothetical protein